MSDDNEIIKLQRQVNRLIAEQRDLHRALEAMRSERNAALDECKRIKREAVQKAADVVEKTLSKDFEELCKQFGIEPQASADAPASIRIASTLKWAVETMDKNRSRLEAVFDLAGHLRGQIAFSERTFGPGRRTAGVLAHIRKELVEIEAQPDDLTEWIDVVLLAFDGAWRHGGTPETITHALMMKQFKNEQRTWPDWRTMAEGEPICHVKNATPGDDAIVS